MIPDSLRQLLDATKGQREAEWQGRRVLLFNTAWGELAISLQGAQVLHYLPFAPDTGRVADARPAPGKEDGWLWVTPTPQALPGTIRGGIPVCWPWFADESPDGRGPMHGTARQAEWRLDGVDDEDEGVEVHLSPTASLDEQLTPRVMIHASAQRLHVELITEHRGETPVKLTAALHTYFAVAHVHQCRVEGLAGARYLDKRRDFSEAHQQGELGVRGPLDRIYESNRPVILDDGERRLRIAKQGSDSTVVWHPDSQQLPGDTPAEAGLHFLCVEAACTRIDPVWLVPGAQHLLATTLTREDLAQ
ncbi:D-hexose-6-phosphate mutarotase [Chromohalobacter israelensis]|uniref:D-hexose-6-phosphate mutarotase n=1 Tax=Chromohalobacter israelensis TaxID=141390 RepID=UPI001CC4B889|nr:D-hexose-6-phosphate mutarotase [Chromohalobacter salexigens]MBZ5875644.1 D-hexose-6-phosphate mutarotase [Chromohalobacter salexigens]